MRPTIGTISHGTLRECDLIPAFLSCLEDFAESDIGASRDYNSIAFFMEESGAYEKDGSFDENWFDSGASQETLNDLFDALDRIAGAYGMTFGSLDGDGSDFGFWNVD